MWVWVAVQISKQNTVLYYVFLWSTVFYIAFAYGDISTSENMDPKPNKISQISRTPAARRKRSKIRKFRVRKKKMIVPKAKLTIKKITRQAIKAAEPPRDFKKYFQKGTDEAELESVINEEIGQLFQLLKTSRRRDLRLRLGSLYVEKAQFIEYRLYEKYDQKMKLFEKGKIKRKPRLNLKPIYVYVNKAIKLFETYRQQYPKDKKMDQVLFFLGVSYFRKNQFTKGKNRYQQLVKRFPKSEYVYDAYFELGEYYFSRSNWKTATNYYAKIAKKPSLRLYSFALYKLAWCRLNRGQSKQALRHLEKVIQEGAKYQASKNIGVYKAGKLHFAKEALNDAVLFYSRAGRNPVNALSYFYRLSGNSARSFKMLNSLAYTYLDQGNLKGVRIAFKQLINEQPYTEKAYDYQYQIIRAYTYSGQRTIFLKELKAWLVKYGPGSTWESQNAAKPNLIKKANKLMEVTVRNYVLRMHQSFMKTKGKVAQNQALFGYEMYNKYFKASSFTDQMRFFYAELLFDVKKYHLAAKHYMFIMEKFPQSKYYSIASLNGVLALEKALPSSKAIQKLVGKRKSFVAFPRSIHAFYKAAAHYVSRFPKKKNTSAILYKMASLHYEFNHHKEAVDQFWNLITQYPKSSYTENAANLILDVYNLQKDFVGLQKAAERLLANPVVARSRLAREIRKILSQISLKSAESLASQKRYYESAELYKSFADSHPRSPLRMTAYYNAGVNFRKAEDRLKTIALYKMVLHGKGASRSVKLAIRGELPDLYQSTAQYRKAALAFADFARLYPKNKKASNFWFNAALIYDGLNMYAQAERAYLAYFKKSRQPDKVQALYLLAELQKRMGRASKAVSYYQQFLNKGSSDDKALASSAFKIAEIKQAKRQLSAAKVWYSRTINIYKKRRAGVFYAAQAKFNLVYDHYLAFKRIKIPRSPKKQQAAVKRKLNSFNKLKEELKQVIRFDSGHQVVAALVLIGLAAQNIGDAIYYSPIPKGLNEEEIKVYKEGLFKTASPFKTESIKNYQLAADRARKLGTYHSKWLKIAEEKLSTFNKSPLAAEAFLRKQVLPVSLIEWSGM